MELLQIATVKFITKCDAVYYKLRQVLQSPMNLLQIATGITKCDNYFKLRQVLQSAIIITNCDSTPKCKIRWKKNWSSPARIWTCTPTCSSAKSCTGTHGPLKKNNVLKFIVYVEVFFSAIHTVWTLWSCIYHVEFKDTFEENSFNEHFKTI